MIRIPRPICGIVPPVLTPLLDRDTLDHASLEKLLEHLIQGASKDEQSVGTTLNQVLQMLFQGCVVQRIAIEQRSQNRGDNAADGAGDSVHKNVEEPLQ